MLLHNVRSQSLTHHFSPVSVAINLIKILFFVWSRQMQSALSGQSGCTTWKYVEVFFLRVLAGTKVIRVLRYSSFFSGREYSKTLWLYPGGTAQSCRSKSLNTVGQSTGWQRLIEPSQSGVYPSPPCTTLWRQPFHFCRVDNIIWYDLGRRYRIKLMY